MGKLSSFRPDRLFQRMAPVNRHKPAEPPGSLIHLGERRADRLTLTHAVFDEASISLEDYHTVEDLPGDAPAGKITWIHVTGLHDTAQIAQLGERFSVHPLLLEDILNTHSRSKIEDHQGLIFIVAKLLSLMGDRDGIDVQHCALLLLPGNVLLTFLEGPTEVLEPVYERLRTGGAGRIRKLGADYLSWAIIDAVVDNYFHVIDGLMESLSKMEDTLEEDPTEIEAIHLFTLKKDVSNLHRTVRPIREIAASFYHSEAPVLTDTVRPFLRDLSDHALQVREAIDELRDSASTLRDFYLTIASNRMNEVMKVLTCFSTIFLPLTFLAGIYGMNFEYIPELGFRWGYPALWGLFALVAAGMFVLFRKKKWL